MIAAIAEPRGPAAGRGRAERGARGAPRSPPATHALAGQQPNERNSLGVADTRRHRDTERQDRLLHRYLQPSVHPPVRARCRAARLLWLACVITLASSERSRPVTLDSEQCSPFALEQRHHYTSSSRAPLGRP
ncbi:hypothetical protein EVAR_98142_1 [Eumeta japonica]|uniref:Uncharacterized protein n=1 Tax=Eumeta variegata TaxID=151549 RepID=A0A4C1XNX1_EUMVA|nr:hypothetical protein EVAR_98142_1 [Eumeta japonica]